MGTTKEPVDLLPFFLLLLHYPILHERLICCWLDTLVGLWDVQTAVNPDHSVSLFWPVMSAKPPG